MFQNQSKIYINQIITYTLTSHGMLIIFIQWEEKMSSSIQLLHFKVYSSGMNFFRISTSMYHIIHVLNIYWNNFCYPMLLPLDMTNSGVILLVFLPILCPPHPLPFPFLLSQMTFYYLSSFFIYPIIDTFLHNIILQLLCYILF